MHRLRRREVLRRERQRGVHRLQRREVLRSEWGEYVLGVHCKLQLAREKRGCLRLYLQRRLYERRRWGMSGVYRWYV